MEAALACAADQASRSAETFRVGAVLLAGRAIVAAGANRGDNACGLPSVHAEMAAAWKLRARSPRPSHVVVVRLRRDRATFGCARPCDACRRALARLGVRRMTYTTGDPAAPVVTEALEGAANRGVATRGHGGAGCHVARAHATSVSASRPTCSASVSRT